MLNLKSFTQYVTEGTKDVTVAWGRFNPPTIGHEKLLTAVAKTARGSAYKIYASQSADPKKNPLQYKDKIKYMRKMFPKHSRNIMISSKIRTIMELLSSLYDQGFNKVTIVAGSDRVPEYETLANKYNKVKGRHGFYNFDGGINVVSAGVRDPDAEGATGMSASKMRAAAADNDFQTFSKGLPSGFREGQKLFNDVRKGMNLKESYKYRQHIELEKVSDEREEYVEGSLYDEGDLVVIKETQEIGNVLQLGTNYLLVETSNGKYRYWLDQVEPLEEKDRRPGQDPDIKDRPGTQPKPYYGKDARGKKMSKSTKAARDRHFKKGAKMDDDNPAAYKPAPGDKGAKTRPSKHTKKFKKMFGEDNVETFKQFVAEADVTAALKKKAEKSGMPMGILRQVFNRGVAAWRTGHRPGTNPTQWGLARVNSFATKSSGTWGKADKDLAAKVRGS